MMEEKCAKDVSVLSKTENKETCHMHIQYVYRLK